MFSFGCGATAIQQEYKSHKVQKGETVSSISRQYNISKEDIFKLNPNARKGLSVNTMLILPASVTTISEEGPMQFKMHRVKRKQTLFSISQRYNVSIDDLKKYNKELYSRSLKKGEKIRIPLASKPNSSVVAVNTNTNNTSTTASTHTVEPKETKFGIARKYGITIAELDVLNPGVGANLPIGTVLNVPEKAVTSSATIDDENFDFYEVQAKEGFFRLKVKLGLEEEQIVAMNPYAKDGLKEGMILKIPKKNSSVEVSGNANIIDLSTSISNLETKNIAIMLPFQLQKTSADSISANEDFIKENGAVRVALDFYSGVLMATEFAKDKGISVNVNVYDTQASESKTASIISSNNFSNTHAVIGPLLRKNVEKAAQGLRSTDTPVFSPLSNRAVKMSSNLFQTLPTDEMLEERMLQFLENNRSGKNTVIISDTKHSRQKAALLKVLPNAKTKQPREKGFLYALDITELMQQGTVNWVILASSDPVIVSNVVGILNGIPDSYQLRLFTLDKNEAYDYNDVSNMHLAKLNFTFPSVNKSYDFNERNAFVTSYKNKHGVLPNRYAVRGFDVTYDVLLRLASADDMYDATSSDYSTEYIENRFRYSKKMFSGYQNNALYIIKYTDNLIFEVVE